MLAVRKAVPYSPLASPCKQGEARGEIAVTFLLGTIISPVFTGKDEKPGDFLLTFLHLADKIKIHLFRGVSLARRNRVKTWVLPPARKNDTPGELPPGPCGVLKRQVKSDRVRFLGQALRFSKPGPARKGPGCMVKNSKLSTIFYKKEGGSIL